MDPGSLNDWRRRVRCAPFSLEIGRALDDAAEEADKQTAGGKDELGKALDRPLTCHYCVRLKQGGAHLDAALGTTGSGAASGRSAAHGASSCEDSYQRVGWSLLYFATDNYVAEFTDCQLCQLTSAS